MVTAEARKARQARKFVLVSTKMRLSNKKGIIALYNRNGVLVHKVRYLKKQAKLEGYLITF